ncbi:acyltransferase family protein [Planctomycetaceae bacterium SH139]
MSSEISGRELSREDRWSRDGVDAIKGLLILVIVLGHSDTLSNYFPSLRKAFYFFNVQCFLLLPFVFPSRRWSRKTLGDRAVRYLVPYTLFLLLSFALTLIIERFASLADPGETAANLAFAWYSGNEGVIDGVASIRALWFLPTLFSLVALRAVTDISVSWKLILIAGSLSVIACGWMIPLAWYRYSPLGIWNAMFFLVPGLLLWEFIRRKDYSDSNLLLGTFATIAAVGMLLITMRPEIGRVAGAGIGSYDPRDWQTFLLALALPLVLMIGLLGISRPLGWIKPLVFCGRHSLGIYLFHGFLYAGLGMLVFGGDFNKPAITRSHVGWGIVIAVVNISLSGLITWFISRSPMLSNLLFPRDKTSWRAGLGLDHGKAPSGTT